MAVNCIENTMKAPNKEALEILSYCLDEENYALTIEDDGLSFSCDPDARDFKDFISHTKCDEDFLLKLGFEGNLCFSNSQGDMWGHRFENGKYTKLMGVIFWYDLYNVIAI